MSSESEKLKKASFMLLVFAASGGMGKAATVFHKRLAGQTSRTEATPALQYYYGMASHSPELCSPAISSACYMCLRGSRARLLPSVASDHALARSDGE